MRLVCLLIAAAVLLGIRRAPTRCDREGTTRRRGSSRSRSRSRGGCGPAARTAATRAPRRMAALIRFWGPLETEVARGFGRVERPDVVYVIASRSSCERMVFALRDRGKVFILDTAAGDVYRRGSAPEPERRRGAPPRPRPAQAPDPHRQELSPAQGGQGEAAGDRLPEGLVPARGRHDELPSARPGRGGRLPALVRAARRPARLPRDRADHRSDPHETTRRTATLQVVCGRGLVPLSSPHRTVFVRRNSTNSATASCPPGQYLFAGGFQRTNFTTPFLTYGGNYITESRAISPTAWQVTAHAVGWDGGELTAIAYCARDPSLPLVEVQASSPIEAGPLGHRDDASLPAGSRADLGRLQPQRLAGRPLRRRILQRGRHLVRDRVRLLRPGALADRVRLLPAARRRRDRLDAGWLGQRERRALRVA